MHRVRLIHWNATEAEERSAQLQAAGYDVEHALLNPATLRALRTDPPDAVVVDLSRIPSQGRDMAVGLRRHKATRHVPLVFVEGAPGKVDRVRELLPDAVYTTWEAIESPLAKAIANPPSEPVVPASTMAGYSGTPLPKKLGLKTGSVVALINAPERFEETLGKLPEGVLLHRQSTCDSNVTLWFTRSRAELEGGIEAMAPSAQKGGLWILWPKKASGVISDLSQTIVRRTGLDAGLVDFKVCAVDKTWSGLRFSQRKEKTT
jgi:CheY-like chemotaxis protein